MKRRSMTIALLTTASLLLAPSAAADTDDFPSQVAEGFEFVDDRGLTLLD